MKALRRRAAAVLCTMLLAASAQARPEQPALHWVRSDTAASCIEPDVLSQRVETITGPALVSSARAQLTIEAYVESQAPATYTLHLRVRHAGEGRPASRVVSFHTTDCRSLDDTFAFLIAMTIDPELGADGIPTELSWLDEQRFPERELIDLAPAVPPPQQAPHVFDHRLHVETKTSAATPEPWQLVAALSGGNDPSASFALGLALTLSRALATRFELGLALSATTPLSSRTLNTPYGERSIDMQRFAAALIACLPLQTRGERLQLRGCAGPELTGLYAQGSGFGTDRSSFVIGLGGQLRLELRQRVAPRVSVVVSAVLLGAARSTSVGFASGGRARALLHTQQLLGQGWIGVAYEF